ncbi:MAG: hypothetical protein KJP11_02750 [Gammaproteobacteria bacterium]|nr:hypothetical protein [Gammaproteobacteria bacterium]
MRTVPRALLNGICRIPDLVSFKGVVTGDFSKVFAIPAAKPVKRVFWLNSQLPETSIMAIVEA